MTYDVVLFTGLKQPPPAKTFGAYKCAHELRKAGFKTLVINHLHHFSPEELNKILDRVVGHNTLFVGFSNTFLDNPGNNTKKTLFQNFLPFDGDEEKNFYNHLKSINPFTKIIVGGARTFFDIKNSYLDYAIIGYGDLSVVNLAQHLRDGIELKKVRRNIHGIQVINDPIAEGFDFANSDMQWCDDDIVIEDEILPLEISRGCVFSCKFCNFVLNGKKKLDYLKNFETIKQELLYNYEKYNITRYRLLDDTYNDTKEKIDIMLEITKKLPFKPWYWSYIRLDLLSKHPETIDKIIETGVQSMFFGIETLNQKTGTVIGKGYDPDEQVETIRYIKKTYGNRIHLTGSFICGLPLESKSSVAQTMHRLLTKEIPLDHVFYRPLSIMKKNYQAWDSAFDLDMTKFGYTEVLENSDQKNNFQINVNWKNNFMSREEAKIVCETFFKKWQILQNSYDTSTNVNFDNIITDYKNKLFQHIELSQKHDLSARCGNRLCAPGSQ